MNLGVPGGFLDPLPPEMEERLVAEVEPGERLIWTGRHGTARFALMALPAFVFGLFWTGFSALWIWLAVWRMIDGLGVFRHLIPLFGLPFVGIGLAMLGSPIWATRKARMTTYALTDRRLIFIEVGLMGAVRTVSLRGLEIGPIERVERRDGSGDLSFSRFVESRVGHETSDGQARSFASIPHVREVESLVRKALLAGLDGRPGSTTSRTNSGGQP